ncbi:MAG: acylphosphatase [Rhodospirillales bacterium]
MKSLHLVISGRVQGVGYRDWMVGEAARLGLSGWVRNLGAEQVEALVSGPDDAVRAAVAACHRGPRYASVTTVEADPASPVTGKFQRLPSV